MKKPFLLFVLLFIGLKAFTQTGSGDKTTYYEKLDRIVTDSNGEKRLNHILNQEFSRIINSNTSGMIGNYIGISTKDNTLSFAYSQINKGGVLQFKASGGITDGISSFISDSKLNTGVGLGVNYSWISGQKDIEIDYDNIAQLQKKYTELELGREMFLTFSDSEREKKLEQSLSNKIAGINNLKARVDTLEKRFSTLGGPNPVLSINLKLNNIHSLQKSIILSEINILQEKISKSSQLVEERLSGLRNERNGNEKDNELIELQFKIDSLKAIQLPMRLQDSLDLKKKKLKGIELEINQNSVTLANLEQSKQALKKAELELDIFKIEKTYYDSAYEDNEVYEKYLSAKRELLEKFAKTRARSISLSWFTLGGNIENESFKRFDVSRQLTDQIFSDQDLIPSLNFSFTKYKNQVDKTESDNKRSISYLNIGAKILYGNNLKSLKQLAIETSDSIAINKSVVNSIKAYEGDFRDNILNAQLTADYYRFLGKDNNVGLHLRGQLDTQPGLEVVSLRSGVVFGVKSEKDQQSLMNIEVFVGLNDIFKQGEEDSLFSRNIIGIQTTIPFKFKIDK